MGSSLAVDLLNRPIYLFYKFHMTVVVMVYVMCILGTMLALLYKWHPLQLLRVPAAWFPSRVAL